MSFLSYVFSKAVKKQIKKHFNSASKKQQTSVKKETSTSREIRGKQDATEGIRNQAKEQAQQYLKIVKDCAELVNTTVNPEVFFNRYSLMIEHLENLVGLEYTGIFVNSPELPSEALDRVEVQLDAATNEFLDRSFEATKKHADSLKTDNGKKNAIKRYFDNMEKYIDRMSGESLEYFNKMKDANIKLT